MGLFFPKVYLRWREPLAVKRRLYRPGIMSYVLPVALLSCAPICEWLLEGKIRSLWVFLILAPFTVLALLLRAQLWRRKGMISDKGVHVVYGDDGSLIKHHEITSVRLYEMCISEQPFSIIEVQTADRAVSVGVPDDDCLHKAMSLLMERGVTEIFDERGQPASEPGGARS
jgi:hypothetical protein